MPQKTQIILFLATVISVGALSYILGTHKPIGGGGVAQAREEVPGGQMGHSMQPHPDEAGARAVQGGKGDSAITEIRSQPLVANGVGEAVDNGADEDQRKMREAFLAASEHRGIKDGDKRGRDDRLGQDDGSFEETSDFSDGEIVEMAQRLEALEQAFAVDGKRNKSRSGGVGDEEISEIKDQVSNLYDIVGGLPSIDTLETKIAAVDGAIEEMNATMEKLVDLGGRLEKLESGEEGGAEKNENEIKELKAAGAKISESVSRIETTTGQMSLDLGKKINELKEYTSAEVKKSAETVGSLMARLEELSGNIKQQEENSKKLGVQIGVLDKNLRSAVEGYRKVYEGAGRTERRFLEIETFLGNAEERLSAIEANFGPGQQ